ncbi:hypothetical protein [Erwinia persicina]|uniref:hypothetical protein n=1 Tax=Erwinia persicina TaxID=55211 RepID=UPI000788CED6|nr:hypothetical protein [Erwinia persicina]
MLSFIFDLISLFTKLPKSVQTQIIEAITATFAFAFRYMYKDKNKEDLSTATEQAVTPQQWQGTTAAVGSFVPSLYSKKKKEEFANSVIELVKSKEFINQLSKRIEQVQAKDEEAYVALCSIETKRLIIEMMER